MIIVKGRFCWNTQGKCRTPTVSERAELMNKLKKEEDESVVALRELMIIKIILTTNNHHGPKVTESRTIFLLRVLRRE